MKDKNVFNSAYFFKHAGFLLIVYSLIAGLLVPLKPGILSVDPIVIDAGRQSQLTITGYNTHFKKDEKLKVFLKLTDGSFIESAINLVRSPNKLQVAFQIPPQLPIKDKISDAVLLVNSPIDGSLVKPSAISLRQGMIPLTTTENGVFIKDPGTLYQHHGWSFPYRLILEETIRNTYYHVPLWFAMIVLFAYSVWASWKYLKTKSAKYDDIVVSTTSMGLLLGALGLATGAIWAKHTWGQYWSGDIKQNMTAISLLIYLAFFVLRASLEDMNRKYTLSAVYNIFAFVALIPLIFVIPRLTDSLHPGNGGNPALGGEDLDNSMRMVFYPACIGWIFFSLWISTLLRRIIRLERLKLDY